MEQKTFNLIDAVCRDGLGNDVWGVADGGNTSDLFGSEANLEINAMFLYVYVDEDAFFPALNMEEWQEVSREHHASDHKNAYEFDFITLKRRDP